MSRLLSLLAVVAIVAGACWAQEGGRRRRRPFCPLEGEDNFECRSRRNSYKCGAFFEDLSGARHPISWLGAMPDALRKKATRENKRFLRSFGLPVSRKSFLLKNNCLEVTANSRCYAIMQKASKEPLDSCEETILNETGGRPVGDELCSKAAAHAGANRQQFNITIAFYYSACGGPWSRTLDSLTRPDATPLTVRERLCCSPDPDRGGVLGFYRCDGSSYNRECPVRTQQEEQEEGQDFQGLLQQGGNVPRGFQGFQGQGR